MKVLDGVHEMEQSVRMRKNPLPSREKLLSLFTYDMDTGAFCWKERPAWNSRKRAGDDAGTLHYNGAIQVLVDKKLYLAHRLIWKMQTGVDPDEIDHRNGVPSDNRWANLREATRGQNCMNRGTRKAHKGVFAHRGAFQAQIRANGLVEWLGYFRDPEEACAAYRKRAKELHGAFHRQGTCSCR